MLFPDEDDPDEPTSEGDWVYIVSEDVRRILNNYGIYANTTYLLKQLELVAEAMNYVSIQSNSSIKNVFSSLLLYNYI